MSRRLRYETLERLSVPRPVDRVDFIAELCRDKRVLDIGCLDETALAKRDTRDWLHGRIGTTARNVIGIDSSDRLPAAGLVTGARSRILKGDGTDPDPDVVDAEAIDIVVAGEFIEHIANPLAFLCTMRRRFLGREMVLSTPNGVAFANALLATVGREAQHRDHLLTSTYKTLSTLCERAGVSRWRILPYRFFATEMMLASPWPKRVVVRGVEVAIRAVERAFPLRGYGYVVHLTL